MNGTIDRVLAHVRLERRRQEQLKSEGRFEFTCADGGLSNAEKLTILVEEVGETAREVLTQSGRRLARDTVGTTDALYGELLQVAAIAVAWMQSFARRPELVGSDRTMPGELEPIVDMVGGVALFHGERGDLDPAHSEACLCGEAYYLHCPHFDEGIQELALLIVKETELRQIVDEQAEDEGLWFIARTAPEAYLQYELRRLHTAVEDALAGAQQ